MKNPSDNHLSRYVRRVHMYLGLFLTPWLLVYAFSSLVFNHLGTVRGWYGGNLNRFKQVARLDYSLKFPQGITPDHAAQRILRDLHLEGSYFVRGSLAANRFVITRLSPYALERITFHPRQAEILVEKQVANVPSILVRLHTRHGYEPSYFPAICWALGVDLTVLSMLFWIASGLWMWWEIKPARRWGAACALIGCGLFGLLLLML